MKPITFHDIVDFLSKNTHESTCPSCGKQAGWAIQYIYEVHGDEGDQYDIKGLYSLTAGSNPSSPEKRSIVSSYAYGRPVVPVTCFSCGFIKLYDFEMLELRALHGPWTPDERGNAS